MKNSLSRLIVGLGLTAIVLAGCGFRDSIGPRSNDNAVPESLAGEWEGTMTLELSFGGPDLVRKSIPIKFTFHDSTYESYGGLLGASGIYDRFGDTVIVLHNDLPYLALYDLRYLPAPYQPLRLGYCDEALLITATGDPSRPETFGWQRIVLVRVGG